MGQLARIGKCPTTHLETAHWVFNYVGKLLEWEAVRGHTGDLEGEFQLWFDHRFPTVAARGRELLGLVKALGFDTPDKQRILFGKIVADFKLSEIIFL